MKINEINQPQKLDEGLMSTLFGDVPVAALKGLATGKGTKQQLAQDIFLKDFYQDAITSLDNGLKSGYIDKNKAAPSPQQEPAAPTDQAAGPLPTSIKGKMTATSAAPATQTSTNVPASNVKINMPPAPKPAAEQPPMNRQQRRAKGRAEKKQGHPTAPSKFDESYEALSDVFETIMEAGEQSANPSIYEYMLDWFTQYMSGVNWKGREAAVLPYIKAIADTYHVDKGRKAIKRLGQVALSLSKAFGQPAAGAKNAIQHVAQQKAATTPKSAEQLKAEAEALKKTKPREYEKFVKEMPKP